MPTQITSATGAAGSAATATLKAVKQVSPVVAPLNNEEAQGYSSSTVVSSALAPALTLSLGNVKFCLTPCTGNSSVSFLGMGGFSTAGAGGEMLLKLSSFTGNLRVFLDSVENKECPIAVANTSSPLVRPVVEEDHSSPEKEVMEALMSPGQQQLNFTTTTTIKNCHNRKDPDKHRRPSKKARGSSGTKSTIIKISSNSNKKTIRNKTSEDGTPTMANVSQNTSHSSMASKKRRLVAEDRTKEGMGTSTQLSSQVPTQTSLSEPVPALDFMQTTDSSRPSCAISDQESESVDDILGRVSNHTSRIKDILDRISGEESEEISTNFNNKHENDDDASSSASHPEDLEGQHDHNDDTTLTGEKDDHNDQADDDDNKSTSDSLMLSPSKLQTVPLPPKKYPPPCPRWGHSMTAISNDRVLVYGGQTIDESSGNGKTLSDVHIFDTVKRQWYKSFNCEDATRQWPRQWHTATYLPERQLLICFGGESVHPKTQKTTTTAKVMVLDTEIMLWYPPTVSGTVPSGRSGHTATLIPNTNELVVFGGVRGSKWLNSVSVLNTNSWIWSTPTIAGSAPKSRSYHTATCVSRYSETQSSSVPSNTGTNPPREAVVVVNRIVIFGGNDSLHSFKSVHVLETDGTYWRWMNPSVSGTEPLPRTGHSATLLKDNKTICIYGGWDPNADDDDDDKVGNDVEDDNHNNNKTTNNPTEEKKKEEEEKKNSTTDEKGEETNQQQQQQQKDEEDDKIFNDCFLLDTETWTWRPGPKPITAGGGGMIDHHDCCHQGEIMDDTTHDDDGRVGHSAMLNRNSGPFSDTVDMQQVLIFGGRLPKDRFAGDFKTIDIEPTGS